MAPKKTTTAPKRETKKQRADRETKEKEGLKGAVDLLAQEFGEARLTSVGNVNDVRGLLQRLEEAMTPSETAIAEVIVAPSRQCYFEALLRVKASYKLQVGVLSPDMVSMTAMKALRARLMMLVPLIVENMELKSRINKLDQKVVELEREKQFRSIEMHARCMPHFFGG